jgi:magnesium transporter
MQGLKGGPGPLGSSSLNHLRRSVAWSDPARDGGRTDLLSERLHSLLVLELMQDGERHYLNLSVRSLYQHVVSAIRPTHRSRSDGVKPDFHGSLKLGAAIRQDFPPKMGHGTGVGSSSSQEVSDSRDEEEGYVAGDIPGLQKRENNRVVFKNEGSESPQPSLPFRVQSPLLNRTVRLRSASTAIEDHGVTYRERLGGYLHPRDMRRLVTPFSTSNEPDLIVRRHVMLLNFDPLRAIILRDRLLVIVPDGADSVLVQLEKRVMAGSGQEDMFDRDLPLVQTNHSERGPQTVSGNLLQRIFKKGPITISKSSNIQPSFDANSSQGKSTGPTEQSEYTSHTPAESDEDDMDDEWDELNRHEWVNLPFELQCADAVLYVVSSILSQDTFELQQASLDYIQKLLSDHGGLSDDPLTVIRAVKDALREMSSRVKGFVKSLTRVLDEDEDMALMNLTRLLTHPERFIQPVSQEVLEEESDEPELILEAHLQTALTLTNAIDLMQGQIDTAADLVEQKLDSVRNRILYANMMISIVSVCVASASLVGSLLGMNLNNHIDEKPNAFKQTVLGTLVGAVAMGAATIFLLTYSGAIPRSGFKVGFGGSDR